MPMITGPMWGDQHLSVAEYMVLIKLDERATDMANPPPFPTLEEIDAALDRNIDEFTVAAWETAGEIVYDAFPQFREEF